MKIRWHALALALAGELTVVGVQAAIDGVEVLRAQQRTGLRWEYVGPSHPYWVSGPGHTGNVAGRLPVIELAGDASVVLHLPAHAVLRIVALTDNAPAPWVAFSQGTGLALVRKPLRGTDGRSWLVRSDMAQPSVVHLSAPAVASAPIRYGVFLARFELPDAPITYRHRLQLEGPTSAVRLADEAVARDHVRVAAGQALSLGVRGPDRLLVEYRLAAAESPRTALPFLEVSMDAAPVNAVRQPTGAETVAPVEIDGRWEAASRLERVAIDIPPGHHTLELRASHSLLLRASASHHPDLLLPELNLPPEWQGLDGNPRLEAMEQASIAAAESNRWRDISQLAGERLQREARQWPGQPTVQAAADELVGQFIQFQDLAPASGGRMNARGVAVAQLQPPDPPARHLIVGPVAAAAVDAPAVALFHRAGATALRYTLPRVGYPLRLRAMVPLEAAAARLELRDDTGAVTTLVTRVLPLPDDRMRLAATAPALTPHGDWPPGVDGRAARAGGVAPVNRVATVEWWVPAGASQVEIRALDGEVDLAMQWAASTEYFLDDDYLAQLVSLRQRAAGATSAGTQLASALRPLERRVAAAYAQYVANIAPATPAIPRAENGAPHRAATLARAEPDPTRAVELWQQAMQSQDATLRANALAGLARSLIAAGERFTAERVLRSHWVGADRVLAEAAQAELAALYERENDRDAQLLFAAAVASRGGAAYSHLSDRLAAEGEDRMALLAGLAAPSADLAPLLQSALRAGAWRSFDALLAQVAQPKERARWEAQYALSQGRIADAEALFHTAGLPDWEAALREGRAIEASLRDDKRGDAVAAWITWQSRHPGPREWRHEPQNVTGHAGAVVLRSVALNLRSQWWQATASEPLTVRVVGPVRMRVEARPLHRNQESLFDGWLKVRGDGQLWVMPFHQNQPSPGLALDTTSALAGVSVTREIELPAGLHDLSIDAADVPVAARVMMERPSLQLPVLPTPAVAHFTPHHGVAARLLASSSCGARLGCMFVAGDSGLQALAVRFEPMDWTGLPLPVLQRDPVAQKLAANDLDAALALTKEPDEKMRLLLWLAQTRPAERARALALGSAIARADPRPEVRAQWDRLAALGGWTLLPLVDRSAGLRRVKSTPGAPDSPASRIRAALLAPLRPGELRIAGDTRAALAMEDRKASQLTIELAMDESPGLPSLPVRVRVERNGRIWQTVQLDAASPRRSLRLAVPAGKQTVSASLEHPFGNQFVRVRFDSAAEPELTLPRDWHISTRTEPVRVTLAGPVAIRIDRLDKDAVRSEERLILEPRVTVVLPPHSGSTESLYRLYRRQLDPVTATVPPPRPNAYEPHPMPEAPAEWHAPARTMPTQVRFVDTQPLSFEADHTLTFRSGYYRRRDSEATGGETTTRADRFGELGLTWRQRPAEPSWALLADALVRTPVTGSPVLGFRIGADAEVPWSARFPWPLNVNGSVKGFIQQTPQGTGASVTARASVAQTRELSSTLSHTPGVGVFARTFSLRQVSDPSSVDSDVFTRYQATHRRAMTVTETLSWRPWRDTHLVAHAALVTNAHFNLIRPHDYAGELMWRQLVGATTVEAGLRATLYRGDSERAAGITHRELRIGTGTDWWLRDGSRIELVSQLRHAYGRPGVWGGFELRWHWSAGRRLRDFSPAEIDFRALRGWRAPVQANTFEEEP